MSFNIDHAFNSILTKQSIKVNYYRLSSNLQYPIKVSPSNYSRNMAGPEDTTIKGREYIISKRDLDQVGITQPNRGDKIISTINGTNTIKEIIPMIIFHRVVGYRIKTE